MPQPDTTEARFTVEELFAETRRIARVEGAEAATKQLEAMKQEIKRDVLQDVVKATKFETPTSKESTMPGTQTTPENGTEAPKAPKARTLKFDIDACAEYLFAKNTKELSLSPSQVAAAQDAAYLEARHIEREATASNLSAEAKTKRWPWWVTTLVAVGGVVAVGGIGVGVYYLVREPKPAAEGETAAVITAAKK